MNTPIVPSLNQNDAKILSLIAQVLASGNRQNVLLFLFKDNQGNYQFSGTVPTNNSIDADFIKKFIQLASEYSQSMAAPNDDFMARVKKLLDYWSGKYARADINKNNENGSINIRFQ
jgi:hypothetical protein